MKLEQLTLPGMGGAFELPPLSRAKYTNGKKLTKKARWHLKILAATGVPRNELIHAINDDLKKSEKVSYSHTYIESMADVVIAIDSGKTIRTFYNVIKRQLYVTIGMDDYLGELYESIESSGGLTLD